ncbi:MAG: biotin--[acetyl-CoA-carboxylase] ligase [Flavobacteriaceae bacterium]|nr:biotin--[acetyl-CoA-carboxylase] ligase [Flavobacteriaceae bacterium]MCY4267352.1 biotin--[acetyl-CoA-carboxylase] ligase [Flavobacteriaceae bacterium]MCY4299459.1 biotin--[acetyl-CoA-carboxylase] ligase [Flavobacteriaceae bacterium]
MGHLQLIKLRATKSTNDYLKKKALKTKNLNDCVVWALNQTKGKGQGNKSWLSTSGNSLTFSIYKEFGSIVISQHFIINVMASLAICETLNTFGIEKTKIKWSNDIMADNCKISGLLIENLIESSRKIGSIIGVGINVNNRQPYDGIKMTSMQMVTGKSFDLSSVLHRFLECFNHYCTHYRKDRIDSILEEFSHRLWSRSNLKTLIVEGKSIRGKLCRLNADGHLLIECINHQKLLVPHHQVKVIP